MAFRCVLTSHIYIFRSLSLSQLLFKDIVSSNLSRLYIRFTYSKLFLGSHFRNPSDPSALHIGLSKTFFISLWDDQTVFKYSPHRERASNLGQKRWVICFYHLAMQF